MLPEFQTIRFQTGESIFNAGDLAEHLYLIVSGSVELLNKEGVVFATILAGESFGEQAFLAGGIRSASVRANMQLNAYKFMKLRHDYHWMRILTCWS